MLSTHNGMDIDDFNLKLLIGMTSHLRRLTNSYLFFFRGMCLQSAHCEWGNRLSKFTVLCDPVTHLQSFKDIALQGIRFSCVNLSRIIAFLRTLC
jgi:hypothetical protein